MTETTARLFGLLSRLQAGVTASGPDLAETFGVTARTIRRDIERLRGFGYPVESDLGLAGGYRLGRGGSALPPLMLDADEAVAVAICLRAAAGGSVEGVEEAAGRVLSRLEPMLPATIRPRVAALSTSTTKLESRGEAVDRAVLVEISRGCRGSEQVVFVYRDGRGRETERRVEPYRVVNAGRRWYLVAREPRSSEWRTFRMDRIRSPRLTGHLFDRTDPPDAVALVHAAITTAPYRYHARVELKAPLAVIAPLVPATVGVLEAVDDRTTMLTTGGDNLDYLAMHIAMLGVGFRVHEPLALRERFAELAARLAGGD